MNISLKPEWQKYIQDKVASGSYASASEVVSMSLHLMHLEEKSARSLDEEIELGLKSLAEEETIDGRESYQRMKARLKSMAIHSE
jgi:putative addiction module CopG family antidote